MTVIFECLKIYSSSRKIAFFFKASRMARGISLARKPSLPQFQTHNKSEESHPK